MKITCDKEGYAAIESLLDLALKNGGLKNKTFVDLILSKTFLEHPQVAEENIAQDPEPSKD